MPKKFILWTYLQSLVLLYWYMGANDPIMSIKKLQKLQTKCINLIIPAHMNLQEKYKSLHILKVQEIIDLELAKISYKLINKLLPIKIIDMMETDSLNKSLIKTHCYNTIHKTIQNLPRVAGKRYLNSFLFKTIKIIQPLLAITKKSCTISHFVQVYKKCSLILVITSKCLLFITDI